MQGKVKRLMAMLSSGVLTATMLSVPVNTVNAKTEQNYADALEKSLYFYECQQAGELPDWNIVEWRGNATVDDEIAGGWYDAGDHVKFNLPMAYSASMLAWGLYEYGDGVKDVGLWDMYQNNLEYALDYFVRCDLGDEVVFQVGNGQQDHTWWGPVELLEYGMADNGNTGKRPYYKGTKCSAVFGEMSAALASGYVALKGKSSKADEYLEHAENIFKIADTARSDEEYADSDGNNFYRSSHFYDELFWAANWLYIATGNKDYLDKATSYIPNLGKELGTDELKYSWGHCWDDVQQGGMLLYARNTKDETYIKRVQKHLDYWLNDVKELDGGFRWLTDWGCLRYAETAGFLASVACDTLLTDETAIAKYREFAEEQINYALGDNPDNQSYVVGYGENSPKNPHHRTAHSSWNNELSEPETNRHILYGALVGGPTSDGKYEDNRQNYINNEVTTDYNAGFTALLCKMVDEYGGKIDPSFPAPEVRDDEFYVEALLKNTSATGTDISLKFTNHSAWPARIEDNMSFRYYVDLSEVLEAGYTADDVVIRVDRDQAAMYSGEGVKPAEVSGMKHYKYNIYYVEISYPDGRAAIPISEGRHQCETMLAIVFPDYKTGWNAENDYSNQDLFDTKGNTKGVKTDKITVYQNGKLIYGTEPDGTKPDNNKDPEPSGLKGDVNNNGSVEIADLLRLCRHIVGANSLTVQEAENADMNDDNVINIFDCIMLARKLVSES